MQKGLLPKQEGSLPVQKGLLPKHEGSPRRARGNNAHTMNALPAHEGTESPPARQPAAHSVADCLRINFMNRRRKARAAPDGSRPHFLRKYRRLCRAEYSPYCKKSTSIRFWTNRYSSLMRRVPSSVFSRYRAFFLKGAAKSSSNSVPNSLR